MPYHDHCTTPQFNLGKDPNVSAAEGQKWAEASAGMPHLEKKTDGQLIWSSVVHGEWGPEVKQWKMQRV